MRVSQISPSELKKMSVDEIAMYNVSMLKRIISSGYNLNKKNSKGETLLHLYAYKGDSLAIKYLLEAGAKVNIKDSFGKTPLDYANEVTSSKLLQTKRKKAQKILLQYGAKSSKSKPPKHITTNPFDQEIIKTLSRKQFPTGAIKRAIFIRALELKYFKQMNNTNSINTAFSEWHQMDEDTQNFYIQRGEYISKQLEK
mgnify:CR=1 FL=1